jgi:hypothetical protein
MQETKPRTPADDSPAPRPPWIRAVAIVAAVALLGGVLYATWQASAGTDDPDPDPIGLDESESDFSLTDEQAIARFEELDEIRVRAFEHADVGLVSQFAGPGPFKDQIVRELRQLNKDNVTARVELSNEDLVVTENASDAIEIQQEIVIDIRFIAPSGEDVTTQGNPQRFVIDWTLRNFGSRWLFYKSVAVEAEPSD